MKTLYQENQIIKDYGNGLILRTAKPSDVEAFYEFNGHVHHEEGWDNFNDTIANYAKDLLTAKHPTANLGHILIVEDTKTNTIASTASLLPQTWQYEDVQFAVGRPEIVGTHPNYRKKGLIRDQFKELHKMSAFEGHQLQAITGIPFYYRMFDYEMTVDLDGGGTVKIDAIPALQDDQKESFKLREATESDYAYLQKLYQNSTQRSLLSCVRTEDYWHYEQKRTKPENITSRRIDIIEDQSGKSVGFVAYRLLEKHQRVTVYHYEIDQTASWLACTPFILRHFKEHFAQKDEALKSIFFCLGKKHPSYQATPHFFSSINASYTWFIRVADVPAFLETISPVLERRLADSSLRGYTGDLKLNFYTDGVHLNLEQGQIKSIKKWVYTRQTDEGDAKFPYLSFFHILFGHKSFAEVSGFYADCYATPAKKALINTLFPKKNNQIYPLM